MKFTFYVLIAVAIFQINFYGYFYRSILMASDHKKKVCYYYDSKCCAAELKAFNFYSDIQYKCGFAQLKLTSFSLLFLLFLR